MDAEISQWLKNKLDRFCRANPGQREFIEDIVSGAYFEGVADGYEQAKDEHGAS